MDEKEQEILKRIGRAEVPAYLFNRIEGRIIAGEPVQKLQVAWTLPVTLLVAANLLVLGSYFLNERRENGLQSTVSEMQLSPSNQIYHE